MRKSDLDIIDAPLPYVDLLGLRATSDIDLIVIHCTELPDLVTAREYGERIHYPQSGTGNSGHFYIDRDGRIERWVPEDRIAGSPEDTTGVGAAGSGTGPVASRTGSSGSHFSNLSAADFTAYRRGARVAGDRIAGGGAGATSASGSSAAE